MRKIGLLSDTHGYWDDKYLKYFADCDEIWQMTNTENTLPIVMKSGMPEILARMNWRPVWLLFILYGQFMAI